MVSYLVLYGVLSCIAWCLILCLESVLDKGNNGVESGYRGKMHERLAVAQLLMRLSSGFSLGVGVLTNIFIPYPKREAKRESHSYEGLGD